MLSKLRSCRIFVKILGKATYVECIVVQARNSGRLESHIVGEQNGGTSNARMTYVYGSRVVRDALAE